MKFPQAGAASRKIEEPIVTIRFGYGPFGSDRSEYKRARGGWRVLLGL